MIAIFWLIPFLCGCMVGPDYRVPRPCVSAEWESLEKGTTYEEPVTNWWTLFNDPLLDSYIEMAKWYNKDIQIAEASILQARANRQVAASALYPQVIADLNATKTYFSKNGPIFAIGPAAGNPADTPSATTGLPGTVQAPQTQTLFNALMDVSWEIDLFGKNSRGVEAASAVIGRSIEDRNDILLSILAEVAKSYIEVRGMQERVILLDDNIALLEENQKIVETNYQRGLINKLDLDRSEADLTALRASINTAIAEIYKGIYSLSLLTGNLPEALVDEMLPRKLLPNPPKDIAVGLRSDLLRRRPDVRRAERNLAVATANVGVAVASFFPTFTLLGDAGFQSLKLKNLFDSKSTTWAYSGDISIPIFQGGSLIGNLRATEAEQIKAALYYQKSVLTAVSEAETYLKQYEEENKRTKDLLSTKEKYQSLNKLTEEQFQKGLVSKLDFIRSKIQLIQSDEELLQNETSSLLTLVLLYKALGGGWQYCQP